MCFFQIDILNKCKQQIEILPLTLACCTVYLNMTAETSKADCLTEDTYRKETNHAHKIIFPSLMFAKYIVLSSFTI